MKIASKRFFSMTGRKLVLYNMIKLFWNVKDEQKEVKKDFYLKLHSNKT
jgi:hypothetical protein